MLSLPNPRRARPISAPARSPIGAAANRAPPLLAARSLSAGYGTARIVRNAALDIAEGELVAVLGANALR
jgi:branched-chain amino acid transport system ATP-binding protein